MPDFPTRVQPGDAITAGAFNGLVDATTGGLRLSAAFPLVLERTPAGVLLRIANLPRLRFVAIEETIAPGETDKSGHVLDYDAAESSWVDTTESDAFSPQTIERLTDPQDAGVYLAGERRLAHFDPESGRYVPLSGPGPHLAIAQDQIDRGEAGTVLVQFVDGEGDLADTEIEVEAYNWLSSRVWSETPCWISFHAQSRRWIITQSTAATRVLAQVNESGGVNFSDTDFAVDGVVPLDGVYPESAIEAVNNTFRHDLDDDAIVALVWNDSEHQWETWQGICPAVE